MSCIDMLLDIIIGIDTDQKWNQYVSLIYVLTVGSAALIIRDCQHGKQQIEH
jgi:hypothetical protein